MMKSIITDEDYDNNNNGSTISHIALETIQQYLVPYLNLKDILSLISSTRYFYYNFTSQSCKSKYASGLTKESFADQFWKKHYVKRWKSVSLTDVSIPLKSDCDTSNCDDDRGHAIGSITPISITNEQSHWYLQYKRKYKCDLEGRKRIEILIRLEREIQFSKTYNPDLFQRRALLRSDLIMSCDDIWDYMVALVDGTCTLSSAVSPSDNNFEQFTIIQLLESMNHYRICKEFQSLIRYENILYSDTNKTDQQDLEEQCHLNINDLKGKYSLEYGAILIAKYYQSAKEIIADYNNLYHNNNDDFQSLSCVDEYIEFQIDGLTDFMRKKLIARQQRELEMGNTLISNVDEPWPMHWILDEMKILFQNQSDENIHDEAEDNETYKKIVDTRPFQGNQQDYYSINNSLLDKVIQSRKGIPITLCILYQSIVRRLSKNEIEAVNLPGHFMLTTQQMILQSSVETEQVFIDAFHGGNVLTKQGCQELISSTYNIEWDDSFVKPIPHSLVWGRMLRNLLNCYRYDQAWYDVRKEDTRRRFSSIDVLVKLAFNPAYFHLNNQQMATLLQKL